MFSFLSVDHKQPTYQSRRTNVMNYNIISEIQCERHSSILAYMVLYIKVTFKMQPTKWDETVTLLKTKFFLNLEKSPSATTVSGA